MNTMVTPLAPRNTKEKVEAMNRKIYMTIDDLSYKWSLGIEPPKPGDSPSKRSEEPLTIEKEILAKIVPLCFRELIDPLVKKFNDEAQKLYSGWVNNPKAERGVIPERTRRSRIAVTEKERTILLRCLLNILTKEYDAAMTPKKKYLSFGNANASRGTTSQRRLDDSPISFPVSKPKADCKRSLDQFQVDDPTFKKPRLPQPAASRSHSNAPSELSLETLASSSRSAKTSFASDTPSIFSKPQINDSSNSLTEVFTQDAIPSQPLPGEKDLDRDMQYRETLDTSFAEMMQSSEYEGGRSSFDSALLEVSGSNIVEIGQSDPAVDDELSQDMLEQAAISEHEFGEEELKERLHRTFPNLPESLHAYPPCVAYEIARVYLHAGASLDNVEFLPTLALADYETLWKFLKDLPNLRGKPFPERCSLETWDAALNETYLGPRAIYMTGSLRFNGADGAGQLFHLYLGALRLDASHRCGRRFGHDRFLEIDMPSLTGRHIPRCLKDVGERGPEIIIDWLVNGAHKFLRRLWKPFHLKPKERKDRKTDATQRSADGPDPIHRIFFFAVDGENFIEGKMPSDASKPYVRLTIEMLLNEIRPTRKNVKQPFLKLFSRTSLALSRNTPTVTLERQQIRYRKDILSGSEVMTDGGGRISPSLAFTVSRMLGLLYTPSGFQGRIGEAKGFWSVDYDDKSGQDWIEVCESQCKWTRSTKPAGESEHPSHRTFEVLQCSGQLKSADLNLQFLPLLVERASCPKTMKISISRLLVEGLHREIKSLEITMDSRQAFRKWARDANPNMKEKLKCKEIPYIAALPSSLEERIAVLIDNGFDPKKLYFLKEMARVLIRSKCDELRRKLNITVGQSAYVYIIPDFTGILEAGEVHFEPSNFVDEVTGLSAPPLKDVHVLVARCPAHFASDIQKVKVVHKEKLYGLKDVIVFPTKGNPSLAAKLSGGDYDGDIAWVSWQKELVDNFVNAEVPQCPDLVNLGYIRQDKTSYEELVMGCSTPVSVFLEKSFAFNMKKSMLGICTNYKEKVAYTLGSADTPECIFLSSLLSALVDAPKQGYFFTEDDFNHIKKDVIIFTPKQPLYKTDYHEEKSEHIIDLLVRVAHETIEAELRNFHDNVPNPPQWDEDLVTYYKSSREEAKQDPPKAKLLDDLDADLAEIAKVWRAYFNRPPGDPKPNFLSFVVECHDKFHAIVPHERTSVAITLLQESFPDPQTTSWALLKASAFFNSYSPHYVSNAVWWLAARQLGELKWRWNGKGAVVVRDMYVALKPDASFIRALRNEDEIALWETKVAPASELDDD